MRCFFCQGAAHPTTGCQYSENVIACYSCTTEFWKWFRQNQNMRGRPGRDKKSGELHACFYTAAGKYFDIIHAK